MKILSFCDEEMLRREVGFNPPLTPVVWEPAQVGTHHIIFTIISKIFLGVLARNAV